MYTFLIMEKVRATAVLIENDKDGILVLRRQKGRPEPNTYGLVGGKIDLSEDKKNACIRKIYEETKLVVDPKKLEFLKTYHREWKSEGTGIIFEIFRYKLNEPKAELVLDPKGASGYLWESPQELYKRNDLMAGLYVILKDVYKL